MTTNKKLIAKNTILLYGRTIFAMAVGLLASRILLNELGTDNYGLYNLVGSVVMMFASLRVILATSTQRFLNYQNGEDNIIKKTIVFKTSEKIHWFLCGIFLIIAEIGGLYLLNYKMDISSNMYVQANCLLQLSIFTAIMTIMTIPYDAVIISNENFGLYAVLFIAESFLKLVSAALLFLIDSYKLIYYGLFILFVAISIRLVNIVYCRRHYPECYSNIIADRETAKDLCKFAGWNFLGNTAYTFCNEGINIVINLFGGVVANAARAIAYQVYNAVSEVCAKVISAASPQAIRIYSHQQYLEFNEIISLSTRVIVILYLFIALPIGAFTEEILLLWLGEITPYTITFVRVILIYGLIRAIHFPIDLCFKASGKMACYQITELICLLPSIPLAYILLSSQLPLYYALIAMIVCNVFNTFAILAIAKHNSNLNLRLYISRTATPCLVVVVISVLILFFVCGISIIILKLIIIEGALFTLSYALLLSQKERMIINQKIIKTFSHIK